MTREDIGSYLGLTGESVSRSFSSLKDHGLISINGKEITLHDKQHLQDAIE
ncbi:MAG: helix-turn-helix domain-containing protein [Granulosicoccus sp.]